MNPRTLTGAIVAAVLVIGTLTIYSSQTSEKTVTYTTTEMIGASSYTVIFSVPGSSAITTTTTSLGPAEVQVRSGSGPQPVLCSWTSYFTADTLTSANASAPIQTIAIVSNYTTTILKVNDGGLQITTAMGVFVSATNVTQSVGYVTTSTTRPNYGLSSGLIATTCTFIP